MTQLVGLRPDYGFAADTPHLTAAVPRRAIKVGDHLVVTSTIGGQLVVESRNGPDVRLEVRLPSLVEAE